MQNLIETTEEQIRTAFELTPNSVDLKKMLTEFKNEVVKNCSIPAVVGQSEQLVCDHNSGRRSDPLGKGFFCEKCASFIEKAN